MSAPKQPVGGANCDIRETGVAKELAEVVSREEPQVRAVVDAAIPIRPVSAHGQAEQRRPVGDVR